MNREQAEDFDPWEYEPDFDNISEEEKEEYVDAVNDTRDLSGNSLSLIVEKMKARSRVVDLQEHLEKLPPQNLGDKIYWLKRGYWFFSVPSSWAADVDMLEEEILSKIESAKTAIDKFCYLENLVDERREKIDEARVSA